MISIVAVAFHAADKKCIVILNVGGVIETADWRDTPDAILLASQAGQETGNAIVDVLSGKENPSGKLATTFPVTYDGVSSSTNFPGKVIESASDTVEASEEATTGGPPPAKASEVVYQEGIYVGYRYHDTFGVDTAYPFGHGLSYTTFSYENLFQSAKKFDKSLKISLDVKNTGERAGKEVVQLYISAPAKTLDKPAKELKAFAKTKLLQPGEKQTITFEITARQLASFDTVTSSWVAEEGKYEAKIGASSRTTGFPLCLNFPKPSQVKTESRGPGTHPGDQGMGGEDGEIKKGSRGRGFRGSRGKRKG